MDYSRKISERQWNLPEKGELESRRETTYIDDIIQKDHIQRKLLEHLDGISTVFDGGAGSGRFSILLAKQGCRVTHFDISRPMIDKARELAEKEGVSDRITFVKGALEDLNAYKDREFDLVISFDAPISYTYPNQNRVISELVRIAGKRIAFSVSSRLGSLPYLANPIQKNQFSGRIDDPAPDQTGGFDILPGKNDHLPLNTGGDVVPQDGTEYGFNGRAVYYYADIQIIGNRIGV